MIQSMVLKRFNKVINDRPQEFTAKYLESFSNQMNKNGYAIALERTKEGVIAKIDSYMRVS